MNGTWWFLGGLVLGCAVLYPTFRVLLRWKREQQ